MKFNKKATPEKEIFRNLHGMKKVQYIFDYYKLHLAVLLIILYIIGYIIYSHFTHKDTMLYAALVNITAGESLTTQLSTDFLNYLGTDTDKNDFHLYTDLYLTENKSNPYYEYTYATQIKILAAIESEQLDVVLMNQESFDMFSQNGYLCNLRELLSSSDSDLFEKLEPYIVTNTAISKDNTTKPQLDSSDSNDTVTYESPTGLDMLALEGILQKAGFKDKVYLGVIENSPRKDKSIDYIKYLFSENALY